MNFLFVEDDDDKAAKISLELAIRHPEIVLIRAKSFTSGLQALVRDDPKISAVILDMSMPNFDNSREAPENFAGRDLLRQCKRRKLQRPTVVVTMLDRFGSGTAQVTLEQLDEQLSEEFSPSYLGIVYFSSVQEAWKEQLSMFVSTAVGVRQ